MDREYLHPAIAQLDEEPLSAEEWARLAAVPLSEDEIEDNRALIRWFKRRYPTVKERLAYVRRKYLEVTRRPAAIRRHADE